MSNVANKQIRDAAKSAGICLWQIADRMGMNDGNFSRKLRRELPPREQDMVMRIIEDLAAERAEVS